MIHELHIETLPWSEQKPIDDASFRRQVAYVLANSRFYRQKLGEAGFHSAGEIGGLDEIAAVPFTEKDELRKSCSEADPIGASC